MDQTINWFIEKIIGKLIEYKIIIRCSHKYNRICIIDTINHVVAHEIWAKLKERLHNTVTAHVVSISCPVWLILTSLWITDRHFEPFSWRCCTFKAQAFSPESNACQAVYILSCKTAYVYRQWLVFCVDVWETACVFFFISHVKERDKRTDVWWHPTTSRHSKRKWVLTVRSWLISSLFLVNELILSLSLFLNMYTPNLPSRPQTSWWREYTQESFLRPTQKKEGRLVLSVPRNDASLLGPVLVDAPSSGSPLWSRPLWHPWEQHPTERVFIAEILRVP